MKMNKRSYVLTVFLSLGMILTSPASNVSAKTDLSSPKGISVSSTTNSITLNWNEVSGAEAYRIYIMSDEYETGQDESLKMIGSDLYLTYKNVNGNTCKVSGLDTGKTYHFRVSALDKTNKGYEEGKISGEIEASTKGNTANDGWRKIDNEYYYYSNGKKLTGVWKTIDGKQWYFCSDGHAAIKELIKIDGKKYWFREDGTHVRCVDKWTDGNHYTKGEKCTIEDIIVNSGIDSVEFAEDHFEEKLIAEAKGGSGNTINIEVTIDKKTKIPDAFFISYDMSLSSWWDTIDNGYDILNYPDYPHSATYKMDEYRCIYYDYEDEEFTMFWLLNVD